MLQPGIDFVDGVEHEGNILHRDPQAFLVCPRNDSLGCFHRRKASFMDFGRNKREQKLIFARRERRRFARVINSGDRVLQLGEF